MNYKRIESSKWRKYQTQYQRKERVKFYKRRLPFILSIFAGVIGLFFLIFIASAWFPASLTSKSHTTVLVEKKPDVNSGRSSETDLVPFLNEALADPARLPIHR